MLLKLVKIFLLSFKRKKVLRVRRREDKRRWEESDVGVFKRKEN